MSQSIPREPKHINAVRYGRGLIEDQQVACCLGDDLMVYSPIVDICSAIGADPIREEQRILNHHALRQGYALISFPGIDSKTGTKGYAEFSCISVMQLHSWLNIISVDELANQEVANRLSIMQERLGDIIYAIMGRPAIPEDVRVEQEQQLPPEKKALYASVEQVVELNKRLDATDEKLRSLEVAMSLRAPDGSFIDKKMQEVYRAMLGMVEKLYIKKGHEWGDLEKALITEHNFATYKVITIDQWVPIVEHLIAVYKSCTPAGTPLPAIFHDALKMKPKPPLQQNTLF